MGARLITRTTRHLVLTEPGRHYLESCRRVLAELDAAEQRLAGGHDEPSGELAVTAPVVFGRLHVLPIGRVSRQFPPRHRAHATGRSGGRSDRGEPRCLGAYRRASRLFADGDPGGRDPPGQLRQPGLSCRARRAVLAAGPRGSRLHQLHHAVAAGHLALCRAEAATACDAQAAPHRQHGGGGHRCRQGRARHCAGVVYQAAASLAEGRCDWILEDFEPEPIPVSLLHREDRLPQAKVQGFIALATPRLRQALKPGVAGG